MSAILTLATTGFALAVSPHAHAIDPIKANANLANALEGKKIPQKAACQTQRCQSKIATRSTGTNNPIIVHPHVRSLPGAYLLPRRCNEYFEEWDPVLKKCVPKWSAPIPILKEAVASSVAKRSIKNKKSRNLRLLAFECESEACKLAKDAVNAAAERIEKYMEKREVEKAIHRNGGERTLEVHNKEVHNR